MKLMKYSAPNEVLGKVRERQYLKIRKQDM